MIIGIDLGTTHSATAVHGEAALAAPYSSLVLPCGVTMISSPYGERTVPSVLWIDADDASNVLVGIDAVQKAQEGVSPVMFSKRLIGTEELLEVNGHRLSARQAATHVLAYLKRCAEQALGQPVERAVVTHPARFSPAQVEETRQAAIDAGFDMSLPEQMLMEPAAAALAYLHDDPRDPLRVLTYDLGGGTFDVTVLERSQGLIALKAFDGDEYLGGYNFDQRLAEWIVAKAQASGRKVAHDPERAEDRGRWARLLLLAEEVKIRLSEQPTARVPVTVRAPNILVDTEGRPISVNERITRAEYTALIADYLARTVEGCQRALARTGLGADGLDLILLVGGSTHGPWVAETLKAAFEGVAVEQFEADLSVAAGAAVRSAKLPKTTPPGRGIRVVLDVPPTSQLATVDIAGTVTADDGRPLTVALRERLRVLLTGGIGATPAPAVVAVDGRFRFADMALDYDAPTEWTLTIVDDVGLERFAAPLEVAYTDEGADDNVYPRLPRQLAVKTSEGLLPLAEEGAELPTRIEVELRRLHGDTALAIPLLMEDVEIGTVRVADLAADGGDGGRVTLRLEVSAAGRITGEVRVATRRGEVIATQPVRIVFPPQVVPSMPELRARFDELEAQRAQDADPLHNADPVRRLAMGGAGKRAGAEIAAMLGGIQPDRQEVHARLREFERLVRPPRDDMMPSQAEFVARVERCREAIRALGSGPLATGHTGALDQIVREGEAAYAGRNRKRWALINQSLDALIARVTQRAEPGPPTTLDPTPLLKDAFRHEIDRHREVVEAERERYRQHPDFGAVFAGRYAQIDADLDRMERLVELVADELEPSQGLAKLRLAVRGLDAVPQRAKNVPHDIGAAASGSRG